MQQANTPAFLRLHPKHQNAMSNMVKILLVLAGIQLVAWLLPAAGSEYKGIPYYLPLHTFLEMISIIIRDICSAGRFR